MASASARTSTWLLTPWLWVLTAAGSDGFWMQKRITIRKRLRRKVKEVTENLRDRMHRPVHETGVWLGSVLRGVINYYGIPGNMESLKRLRDLIARAWFNVLRRRSQKGKAMTWDKFDQIRSTYFPNTLICHPFPSVRFDARYSR